MAQLITKPEVLERRFLEKRTIPNLGQGLRADLNTSGFNKFEFGTCAHLDAMEGKALMVLGNTIHTS